MFKQLFYRDKRKQQLAALMLLIGSLIGLLVSFVLSIEALILAKNTHAVLNCDINAALSCSVVAQHWSAEILGFPNSFIGMMALPVMVTIAVALLFGVSFPKWFMRAAYAGTVFGLVFSAWMFYMSYGVIGVLCPWCLLMDVAMLFMFYGINRYSVLAGIVRFKGIRQSVQGGYDTLILYLVIVIMIVVILGKFGEQLL